MGLRCKDPLDTFEYQLNIFPLLKVDKEWEFKAVTEVKVKNANTNFVMLFSYASSSTPHPRQ